MEMRKYYTLILDEQELNDLRSILWWSGGGCATRADELQTKSMTFWHELDGLE